MTIPTFVRALAVTASLLPAVAAASPVQRYVLIAGANHGGGDRARLKYAVSDAERFAQVMAELGGVAEDHEIILREPRVGDLLAALDSLKARLSGLKRGPGDRIELVFYYSGHADELGLLLGEDRLSYRSLRNRLDAMPADVRIAVLDACASGAFTRLKGGRRSPAFLVDESAAMRGHAFITSSAETEAAQESDRIRASYFTHYLVSGFRGAADASGDGLVTLNEAYQFAFTETLGRTVDSKGGAQHPSYDINLSGAGDVVITDVRRTTARLVLPEALEGRLFIRNSAQRLVVELYKPKGREVEIALEPGAYEIRVERVNGAMLARTDIRDGAKVVLTAAQFGPAAAEPTARRGDELPRFAVAGRNRLTLQSGLWGSHGGVVIADHNFDYSSGLQFAHYVSEALAIAVSVTGYGAEAHVDLLGGWAVPITLQWNPRRGQLASERLKPFLSAGLVPVSSADFMTDHRFTLGAHLGAGFDYQVANTFALGAWAGFNFMPELSNPSGLHDNFGGPEVAVRVSWLMGRGR
jgi:hypothetical protein